jgi:7-keto-8-aminopelargonate synthetase-like enzyme
MSHGLQLHLDRSVIDEATFNPYGLRLETGLAARVRLEGRSFVDLASNNYLGLAMDPRVLAAACRHVERFGVSTCGTPVATGATVAHEELENRLARFVGVESAMLLPSCYQLGSGFLRIVAGIEDCVLVDHDAHSSLVDGARAVGCKIRPFRHNDVSSLEKNLRHSAAHPRRFVLTESVFSTQGTVAPLQEMARLCEQYGAILVVDDSHGIGVLGPAGQGALRHFGLDSFPGIYIASLGKALGGLGGVLGASREVVEYLRYSTPSLIYSTGLSPASVGALLEVLEILQSEGETLVARMFSHCARIRAAFQKRGFTLTQAQAPINAVVMGSASKTVGLSKKLYERGILSTPFIPPSVASGRGTVRLIAGAHLDEEALSHVESTVQELEP